MSAEIRALINDYTHGFMWVLIAHTCPNFNDVLVDEQLCPDIYVDVIINVIILIPA